MIVKELIEKLKQFPEDEVVITEGYIEYEDFLLDDDEYVDGGEYIHHEVNSIRLDKIEKAVTISCRYPPLL